MVAYHIRDPFIEEGGLIDDKGTHRRVLFEYLLEGKRVADFGDVWPALDVATTVSQSILRVVGEASPIDFATDEEYLAAVDLPAGGQLPHPLSLLLGDRGITPDPGGKLRLARAHGPDDQNPPTGVREIKVTERIVDI